MASIQTYLDKIKQAIYGEEVRGSIVDAISAINVESEGAKTSAQQSAQSAKNSETVVNKVSGMTVSASELSAGSTPTASVSDDGTKLIITFGIPKATPPNVQMTAVTGTEASVERTGTDENPVFNLTIPKGDKGDTGDTGLTPNIQMTATTGEAGTEASVERTGTDENPVFNLTIPKGDVGPEGPQGKPFAIIGQAYPSIDILEESVTDPEIGDMYNVGLEAPYDIYRWTGTSWENQGPIQGPEGPQGVSGITPNVQMTATTGEPGTEASVERTGTDENPVFNLTIPKGDKGDVGEPGKDAVVDVTLTQEGQAADAKATGDALNQLKDEMVTLPECEEAPGTAPEINAGTFGGMTVAQFVDMIYPVGSIYMSASATSPATLFGGTWESIGGRFLLGADATYTAGSMGGTETHTLTEPESPVISGAILAGAGASGSGTADGHGALRSADGVFSTSLQCHYSYDSADKTTWTSTDTDSWQQVKISFGGGQPHNNMPPYLAVFIWQRTA